MTQTRSTSEIRRDIERTREELAQTAAALAERADVKARMHDKVDETRGRITGKVAGTRERVSHVTPDAVAGTARQRPIPTAVLVGTLAGVVLGYLIARRR